MDLEPDGGAAYFIPTPMRTDLRNRRLEAVGQARKRCWRYDWVLDLDIKGFFDNLDHELSDAGGQKACPRASGSFSIWGGG